MADKDNQKIADQPAILQEDPFAELTRIVGFDPRQPVKPAAASVAAANKPSVLEPVNTSFDETDFSIDLERELLGDLQLDDAELLESSQPYRNGFAAAEAPSVGEEPSVKEDLTSPAAQAAERVEVEAIAEDELLESDEGGSPAADELELTLAEAAPTVDVDLSGPAWEEPAPLAGAELAEPADARGEQAVADALEAELVEAATESFPMHTAVEDDVAIEKPMVVVAAHAFGENEEQVERDEPQRPDPIAATDTDRSDEPEQYQAHDDDWFQGPELHSFDVALSEEDQREAFDEPGIVSEPASIEPAEIEVAARQPVAPRQEPEIVVHSTQSETALEMSLEAELNALLGNGPAKAAAPAILAAVANKHADVQQNHVKPISYGWNVKSLAMPRDEAVVDAPHIATGISAPVDLAEASLENHLAGPAQQVEEGTADPDLDGLFDDEALEAALSSAVSSAIEETSGDASGSAAEVAQKWESENFMPSDGRDPYAASAPLSPEQKSSQSWPQAATHEPYFDRKTLSTHKMAAAARLDAPEIDTVDVPERAVAVADDLDLPEIAFEDEAAKSQHYDDIDAEFSTLLAGMNTGTDHPEPVQHSRYEQKTPIRIEPRDEVYHDERHAAAAHTDAATGYAASRADAYDGYDRAYSDEVAAGGASQANGPDTDLAYDPDFEEEIAGPAYAPIAAKPRRRGMLAAAVVGGVALLGGVVAFALTFGDSPSGTEVALVKADSSPVKVKPENPGGTAIPNQDSKVYDSVAGSDATSAPTQEKLLDSAEEPVPMPEDEPVDAADDETAEDVSVASEDNAGAQDQPAVAAKGDDRIEQLIEEEPGVDRSVEVAAVAPRKVRTMIVKSDGTLVAREEPVADQPVDSASEGIVDPAVSMAAPAAEEPDTGTAAEAAAEQTTSAEPAAPAAAEQPQAAAEQPAQRNAGKTPKTVPVAPVRPSDQPVDIVGEVKAEQVAALDPASAPAPGSWSMQIASQPSEAGAQATYKDLARRYGSVLDGRQAMIVKADIAGKGTFWRVRVPAGSRNEAVKLCESYKSAGGNCFVSK